MKKLLLVCLLMFHHAAIAADDHEALVMQAYATFGNGDAEGWAALHTEDLAFTIFGALPHPVINMSWLTLVSSVGGYQIPPAWTGSPPNKHCAPFASASSTCDWIVSTCRSKIRGAISPLPSSVQVNESALSCVRSSSVKGSAMLS